MLDETTLWDSEEVWEGLACLLDEYTAVGPDDTVIIAYTPESRHCAALVSVALDLSGVSVRRLWMTPLRDDGLLDRLNSVLPLPGEVSGRLILMTFERDTMSHGPVLVDALSKYDQNRCVIIRAISACPELFSSALRVPPDELSARNTAILERCMAATTLRIETPSGTSLRATLDAERYEWVSNRGVLSPGRMLILPAGEVATFPASIEGVLVADCAYNANVITDSDARLHDHPVTVTVERARAVHYECDDAEVLRFLAGCFEIPNATNVGELGFGTNYGVDVAIPLNSHVNERRPGVHLGFGDHNQHAKDVDYSCHLHIDLIARGGTVWVDDDPVPLELEAIVPSSRPHPTRYRDDDVKTPEELSTECCGVLDRATGRIIEIV